tara:strand:+ start:273 stop:533 length:261 start_codon:yes stop_codon:yes gene_type:complete
MNSKIKWKNIEPNEKPNLSVTQDIWHDAVILYRVEQWLKGEINDNKNQDPQKSDAEEDRILSGRLECAEGLSNLISTWRKELRGLE